LPHNLRRELDSRLQAIDESMTLDLVESDATIEVFYARPSRVMTALQITAILKTDIKGSTPTFRALPESDLAPLLTSHRGAEL